MNILLINVPSRKGQTGLAFPLGLLYVGAIIERCGHKAKIFDPYLDNVDLANFDHRAHTAIERIIDNYRPSLIGFGGIATSYGRAKNLSLYLKNKYPNIMQIAGGTLSSAYELLLTQSKVDVVFHGETEISLANFLTRVEKNKSFYDIASISYLLDGKAVRNYDQQQIDDLDEIPLPAYHLIDMDSYLYPIKNRIRHLLANLPEDKIMHSDLLKRIENKGYYADIVSSRGCTHKCSFCFRHNIGIRQHSAGYVIEHMKHLKSRYGVDGFSFHDELFNADNEWILEFCDLIEKEKLDIFYIIGGARVDKVNEKILHRLKETGCIEVNYGQESGSDTILKEYRKGVSSRQNKEATLLTRSLGIACPVQLVIGSPSENKTSIEETVRFLKEIDAWEYSLNYLIPLPGAPIWQFVMDNRLIPNVERYLDLVADYGGIAPLVNLTKVPNRICASWSFHIRKELKLSYYKRRGLNLRYLHLFIFFVFVDRLLPFIPYEISLRLKAIVRRIKILTKRQYLYVKD